MAEFQNQKEFIQKTFYPINFKEPGVLNWLEKTCKSDYTYVLNSLQKLYDSHKGKNPNELKEKKIFQNYLYQNFYLKYKSDFDKFEIPYEIPTIAYWTKYGTFYFIPISEYEGDVNKNEKDILSKPNKTFKGVNGYDNLHSIGKPSELFFSKLNSDVEYLNSFIKLLNSLTLPQFVTIKKYFEAKNDLKESSIANKSPKFVKVIRYNSDIDI